MRISRVPHVIAGLGLAVAASLAATLGTAPSAPTAAPVLDDARPAFNADCIGYCKHPTNAAKVFRWGSPAWHDEFEVNPLTRHWKSDHPGLVNTQRGMIAIHAKPGTRSVSAWPDNQAAVLGRWEARVLAREYDTTGGKFVFSWELAPAADPRSSCSDDAIVLSSYRTGDQRVRGAVRTPGHAFRYSKTLDLRSRAWHTYAVEVTRDHVSWFVDTRVVRTERRPEALSGVRLRPRFRIAAPAATSGPMRTSAMQMDWVRYYTLERRNARSIAAPQMRHEDVASSCS